MESVWVLPPPYLDQHPVEAHSGILGVSGRTYWTTTEVIPQVSARPRSSL